MPATATDFTGTIVNGRVELDAPAALPDGTRVRFVLDTVTAEEEDAGPPADTHDRETERAILRESHAVAGRTRPLDVVMAEIRAKYNFPPKVGG